MHNRRKRSRETNIYCSVIGINKIDDGENKLFGNIEWNERTGHEEK